MSTLGWREREHKEKYNAIEKIGPVYDSWKSLEMWNYKHKGLKIFVTKYFSVTSFKFWLKIFLILITVENGRINIFQKFKKDQICSL